MVLQLVVPIRCFMIHDPIQDHTLHCYKLNTNEVLGGFQYFNFFAFNVFRHAVESSTPSFSFFTLTVWNAYQKRETYLKPHANLYVNRHFLTTLKILGNFLCICYFVTLFWFVFQTGSRYDAQVAVFGSEFQKKLSEQKYFIVSGLEA